MIVCFVQLIIRSIYKTFFKNLCIYFLYIFFLSFVISTKNKKKWNEKALCQLLKTKGQVITVFRLLSNLYSPIIKGGGEEQQRSCPNARLFLKSRWEWRTKHEIMTNLWIHIQLYRLIGIYVSIIYSNIRSNPISHNTTMLHVACCPMIGLLPSALYNLWSYLQNLQDHNRYHLPCLPSKISHLSSL